MRITKTPMQMRLEAERRRNPPPQRKPSGKLDLSRFAARQRPQALDLASVSVRV